MFRRVISELPEDPSYPDNIEELGYFINDKDQIRKIKRPDERFQFKIAKNSDRHNETHREAMHIAIRRRLEERMKQHDMQLLHLPHLTTTRPKTAHVPIWTTSTRILRSCKRLIVVVNDESQDLGVLAYRDLCGDLGINGGTCLLLVRELASRSTPHSPTTTSSAIGDAPISNGHANGATENGVHGATAVRDTPGLIILNPGQLLYSPSLNQAMTRNTWDARPVPSIVHAPIAVHPDSNYIPGHTSPEQHIESVFWHVIDNADFLELNAELYIIGMQARGDVILQYLDANWHMWRERVTAIALMEPRHQADLIANPQFKTFLEQQCRAWATSQAPVGTPIAVPGTEEETVPGTEDHQEVKEPYDYENGHAINAVTQPTFSAGDLIYGECVFPAVYKDVVDWFEEVAADPKSYQNPEFEVTWTAPPVIVGDEEDGAEADGDAEANGDGEAHGDQQPAQSAPFPGMFDHLSRDGTTAPGTASLLQKLKLTDENIEGTAERPAVAQVPVSQETLDQLTPEDALQWKQEEQAQVADIKVPKSLLQKLKLADDDDEDEE